MPHMFSASSSDEATARAAGVGRPGRAPQLGPRPRSGPGQAWRPRRWDLGGRMAPWHVETLGPICSKLDPASCSQGTEQWPPRAYPLEPTAPHKGGTPASLGVHPLLAHPSPSLWVNSFTPQPLAPLLTDGDPEAQRGQHLAQGPPAQEVQGRGSGPRQGLQPTPGLSVALLGGPQRDEVPAEHTASPGAGAGLGQACG